MLISDLHAHVLTHLKTYLLTCIRIPHTHTFTCKSKFANFKKRKTVVRAECPLGIENYQTTLSTSLNAVDNPMTKRTWENRKKYNAEISSFSVKNQDTQHCSEISEASRLHNCFLLHTNTAAHCSTYALGDVRIHNYPTM